MRQIILCEGPTDAIVLGYYLEQQHGWRHDPSKEARRIELPVDQENERLNWYQHEKGRRYLAIWGVGGRDNLGPRLEKVVERLRHERNAKDRFRDIVIVFDRDDLDEGALNNVVSGWIRRSGMSTERIRRGEWLQGTVELRTEPPMTWPVHALLLSLPRDKPGALEEFLLDAFAENALIDRNLVNDARAFVDKQPDEPYLCKRRLRPKACLGSVLAVVSPDWVFSTMDDRLRRIDWSTLPGVVDGLGQLSRLSETDSAPERVLLDSQPG